MLGTCGLIISPFLWPSLGVIWISSGIIPVQDASYFDLPCKEEVFPLDRDHITIKRPSRQMQYSAFEQAHCQHEVRQDVYPQICRRWNSQQCIPWEEKIPISVHRDGLWSKFLVQNWERNNRSTCKLNHTMIHDIMRYIFGWNYFWLNLSSGSILSETTWNHPNFAFEAGNMY